MRAVGGAGTSWERQPGQRSFGLDTRGPWAWAALPKRRGLGGPALERGCSRLEREEAPAAHPPSPAPCSQQWPAQTRSPSLASTCVPTDTSSRTHGLTHTHAQRRRLVLTTAHAPAPLPTPEATGLPGACAGTRLAPRPEAACSWLESTKTPEAPGGALGPPEQSGQGRSSPCRDHIGPLQSQPCRPSIHSTAWRAAGRPPSEVPYVVLLCHEPPPLPSRCSPLVLV